MAPIDHEAQQIVHAAAVGYVEAGLSVIPVFGKVPTLDWKAYQERAATADELAAWFLGSALYGVAIVTGHGGLLVLDFDHRAKDVFPLWRELLRLDSDLAPLVDRLPVVITGHGCHVYVRVAEPGRNTVLAKPATGKPYIETRATGGYVVAPPTIHPDTGRPYQSWAGDVTEIPLLSTLQHEKLLAKCRAFDERAPEPKAEPKAAEPAKAAGNGDGEWGSFYASRALANAVALVEGTPEGNRNRTLFSQAAAMFELVNAGALARNRAAVALRDAAIKAGLSRREAENTIKSANRHVGQKARAIPAPGSNQE